MNNIKRIAGFINIIAAIAFLFVGFTATPIKKFYIVIGVVFLLIGYVRLRRTTGPSAP